LDKVAKRLVSIWELSRSNLSWATDYQG